MAQSTHRQHLRRRPRMPPRTQVLPQLLQYPRTPPSPHSRHSRRPSTHHTPRHKTSPTCRPLLTLSTGHQQGRRTLSLLRRVSPSTHPLGHPKHNPRRQDQLNLLQPSHQHSSLSRSTPLCNLTRNIPPPSRKLSHSILHSSLSRNTPLPSRNTPLPSRRPPSPSPRCHLPRTSTEAPTHHRAPPSRLWRATCRPRLMQHHRHPPRGGTPHRA